MSIGGIIFAVLLALHIAGIGSLSWLQVFLPLIIEAVIDVVLIAIVVATGAKLRKKIR